MKLIPLEKKIFTLALIILLLLLSVIIFVIYPSIKNILDLKHNITVTETYLEEQYQKNRNLKQSIRKIADVKAELAKYSSASLKEGDELKLITDLEDIAEQFKINQNLNVEYIEYDEPGDSGANSNQTKNISFSSKSHYKISFLNQGSYINLFKYLRELEKLDYYLIINSLNFESKPVIANGSEELIILRFEANVYANKN